MTETTFDLARNSGQVSTGMHFGRLVAVEEKEGPKGTYFQYTVRIEEQSSDKDRELPFRVSMSLEARWKLDEFLDAVGAPMEGRAKPTDFLGKLIQIHVAEGFYNDKPRSEIDGVFPAGIEDPNPQLAAQVLTAGTQLAEDPTSPQLTEEDEDIPF